MKTIFFKILVAVTVALCVPGPTYFGVHLLTKNARETQCLQKIETAIGSASNSADIAPKKDSFYLKFVYLIVALLAGFLLFILPMTIAFMMLGFIHSILPILFLGFLYSQAAKSLRVFQLWIVWAISGTLAGYFYPKLYLNNMYQTECEFENMISGITFTLTGFLCAIFLYFYLQQSWTRKSNIEL